MNSPKKSQAKVWMYVFIGVLILMIALFRHPSIKPMLSYNSQQTWQDLIKTLESNSELEAQDLWKFREFYSRGIIFLSKYQPLTVPTEISSNYQLPESFNQYLAFSSSKVQGIEGTIDKEEAVFLLKEIIREEDWEVVIQTDNVQVIEQHKNKALIIGVFDMETASKANGYLHFDFRKKDFKDANLNKKWLVVDYVKL